MTERRLLVDANLRVCGEHTGFEVQGDGERLVFAFDRWRDLVALRGAKATFRSLSDRLSAHGIAIGVSVRGVRLPRWLIS